MSDDKPTEGMPIVVNGKLVVPNKSGKLQVYEPLKGTLLKEYETGKHPKKQGICARWLGYTEVLWNVNWYLSIPRMLVLLGGPFGA